MDTNSIILLKNLFDKCREDDNSTDSESESKICTGTGGIEKKRGEIKNILENPLLKKEIKENDCLKSIEEWNEQQKKDEELLDTREVPEYEICYKQAVTTEDIYLQMGLKTPATSSCEDMVITVKIPNETVGVNQMDLNVKEEKIELKTPVYRFKLSLPHKITPSKSRAEFDADKKVLKLIMRLNREFDFVNF